MGQKHAALARKRDLAPFYFPGGFCRPARDRAQRGVGERKATLRLVFAANGERNNATLVWQGSVLTASCIESGVYRRYARRCTSLCTFGAGKPPRPLCVALRARGRAS